MLDFVKDLGPVHNNLKSKRITNQEQQQQQQQTFGLISFKI